MVPRAFIWCTSAAQDHEAGQDSGLIRAVVTDKINWNMRITRVHRTCEIKIKGLRPGSLAHLPSPGYGHGYAQDTQGGRSLDRGYAPDTPFQISECFL